MDEQQQAVLLAAFDQVSFATAREPFVEILQHENALGLVFLLILTCRDKCPMPQLEAAYNTIYVQANPEATPIDFAGAAREARLIWEAQRLFGPEHVMVVHNITDIPVALDVLSSTR